MAINEINNRHGAADEEQSEWEYEYDENETEDYYFTLDVTTNLPDAALKVDQSKRKRLKQTTKTHEAGSTRDGQASESVPLQHGATESNEPTTVESSTPSDGGRLEVLDLHTKNPLIMLDNKVYSCHWCTDLGSQFYVAQPGIADKPLRPGRVLDVIGLSRARLIGRPATLHQLKVNGAEQLEGATAEKAIEIGDEDSDVNVAADTPDRTPLGDALAPERAHSAYARPEIKDPALQARASFLERLQSIKQQKGETDKIPFYGVKSYQLPANRDEIRERALAADAEREGDDATPAVKKKKRGPNKTRGASTTGKNSSGSSRGKSGPKSGASLRASLGFTNSSRVASPAINLEGEDRRTPMEQGFPGNGESADIDDLSTALDQDGTDDEHVPADAMDVDPELHPRDQETAETPNELT